MFAAFFFWGGGGFLGLGCWFGGGLLSVIWSNPGQKSEKPPTVLNPHEPGVRSRARTIKTGVMAVTLYLCHLNCV
jgi:hypothetical protein